MTPVDPSDGEVRVHLVAEGLRRRRILIAALVVLGVFLGIAAGALRTSTYTSTATLLIQPLPGNPLSPDTATSNTGGVSTAMSTEANLVNTPAVILRAEQISHLTFAVGGKAISATNPSSTQIVQIAYTAGSADRAQRGAQALAEAYLEARQHRASTYQAKTLVSLERQAAEAQDSLDDATARAKVAGPNSLAAQQVQIYAGLLATIKDNISQTKSTSLNPGAIVNPAPVPRSTTGLPPWVVPLGLGVVGLVVGVVLAVWLELRRDVVRVDVETEVEGLPVLATLPASAVSVIGPERTDPSGAESLRRLRAGVLAAAKPPRSLAVMSTDVRQSTAPVALNLALALGDLGYRVIVVDAARSGEVGSLMRLHPGPGLGDVLDVPDKAVATCQRLNGIAVLTSGEDGASSDLFAGRRFDAVIEALSHECDYVLVVSEPASTAAADAAAVACDAVLLCVVDQLTTHAEALSAVARLDRLGRHAVGCVVMSRARRRRGSRTEDVKPVLHRRADDD